MTDDEPTETDAPAPDHSYHLGDHATIPKIYEQIEHAGSRGDDYRENLDDPEDEALNNVVEGFSLIMGAFKEGTIGELDGESIAWGITNACYRQLERIRKEHDDVESDLKRLGRMRLDGMEVHVQKLEQRQAQTHHLEKRMVFLEMVHKAAIAVHDEWATRCWSPPSGASYVPRLTDTAGSIQLRHHLAAVKARELDALAPQGPKIVVAGAPDWVDAPKLEAALKREHRAHPDMVLVSGDYDKGPDNFVARWARDNNVPLLVVPLERTKHGDRAAFIQVDQFIALKPLGIMTCQRPEGKRPHGPTANLDDKAGLQKPPIRVKRL